MPAYGDLVHQTTTGTGTGALTLVAVNGKRSFLTAFGTGGTNTFDYYISHREAAEWERGTGHENAGTLVRDTVLASSNAGAAVSFAAGNKDVTNDQPAGLRLNKTGDTMTGALTLPADPSSALHAATKQYVDMLSAGAIGIRNGKVVESRAANAATFSLKTLADADPSASDPVYAIFSDGTKRTITAALSQVISSGSTLGTANNTPFRAWVLLIDDAGTMRLGVVQCCTVATPYYIWGFPGNGICTTVNEGGAGAADSYGSIYSNAVATAKQYLVVGFAEYDAGLTTAGTWAAAPTRIQLYGPHIALPGQSIRTIWAVQGGGETTTTSTTPIITNLQASFAMRQPMNRALIIVDGTLRQISSTGIATITLRRGSTAITSAKYAWISGAASDNRHSFSINYMDASNTTAATTYSIYVSTDVAGQNVGMGFGAGGFTIQEIMG